MSCFKNICNYFKIVTSEIEEYLPTEIQFLIKYKDKYTDDEDSEELDELETIKIDIQDDKNYDIDYLEDFELV